MPAPADTSRIIRALITVAQARGGKPYLLQLLTRASDAFLANKPLVKMLGMEGGSTAFDFVTDNGQLMDLLQGAIDQFDEADPDAPFNPAAPGCLIPRFGCRGIPL